MFLLKQGVDSVQSQVHKSINLVGMTEKEGDFDEEIDDAAPKSKKSSKKVNQEVEELNE